MQEAKHLPSAQLRPRLRQHIYAENANQYLCLPDIISLGSPNYKLNFLYLESQNITHIITHLQYGIYSKPIF